MHVGCTTTKCKPDVRLGVLGILSRMLSIHLKEKVTVTFIVCVSWQVTGDRWQSGGGKTW